MIYIYIYDMMPWMSMYIDILNESEIYQHGDL